ncbi:MAG: N-formylglutamate amidohydrolase [Polyangiaceae bacterium]
MAAGRPASEAFVVVPSRGREIAVVVEAPHAGLGLDGESLATLIAPARSIARDADLYVDRLIELVPDTGAVSLISKMSRYYLDLNRGEDEHDGVAVYGSRGRDAPHGLVWHRTTDGERCLSGAISRDELERRLKLVYRPYHEQLRRMLLDRVAVFGHVVLLCAHSMPSNGRSVSGAEEPRADIVPGTRGQTTASRRLIQAVEQVTHGAGFTFKHDDPYRGGFSTMHYGNPRGSMHAIQIEVARRLYMNESTLQMIPEGVARMQAYFRDLVIALGSTAP